MRIILLSIGLLLLFFQQYIQHISAQGQFLAFGIGILLLGIPHGAADLLVATQNAGSGESKFSMPAFFINYLGRLMAFALVLWFLPLFGNVLFMFLAAYHFGETDLHTFKTDTLIGKSLVTTYGLVILSVIIMPHFNEVRPIFELFQAGSDNIGFINWLDGHRNEIIFSCIALFIISAGLYFYKFRITNGQEILKFSAQFVLILLILNKLPMLLGFTFYFVIWHSSLSLDNITSYLKRGSSLNTVKRITKQIAFYSILAIGGILIFGSVGFMFSNNTAMMAYSFLGLAVLTAPHMQIMHDMYHKIRIGQTAHV